MRLVVELGLDLVARPAGAPATLHLGVLREGIAALNHEALDNPVKRRAVVESLAGEFLEILDRLGRRVGPKLDHHFAGRRFNNGHFVHGAGLSDGRLFVTRRIENKWRAWRAFSSVATCATKRRGQSGFSPPGTPDCKRKELLKS